MTSIFGSVQLKEADNYRPIDSYHRSINIILTSGMDAHMKLLN
ncbi:hypothetical protein [Chamaesiphon sp.]